MLGGGPPGACWAEEGVPDEPLVALDRAALSDSAMVAAINLQNGVSSEFIFIS